MQMLLNNYQAVFYTLNYLGRVVVNGGSEELR